MNKRIPIILGLCLILLSIWLEISPSQFIHTLHSRLDQLGYDLQLRTRVLTKHLKIDTPIVIVDIDNQSLAAEGRWPWPRSKLAKLTDKLQTHGASVIAFDILFSEPEKNIVDTLQSTLKQKGTLTNSLMQTLDSLKPDFDTDEMFSKAISKNHVVLAIGLLPNSQTENALPKPISVLHENELNQLDIPQTDGFISNIPILQNASIGNGFINIIPDIDGVIRHAPLLMSYKNNLYPSLALQAVLSYLGTSIQLVTPKYDKNIKLEGVQIGSRTIPTDETGQVYIPFIGKSYTFPYYSATDVLNDNIPNEALLGKLVFIGTSAAGLGDLQATAIQSPFPGVEIQATIANGILKNNFSFQPAWVLGAKIVITIIFGLIAAIFFPYLGPRTLTAIIILFPPTVLFLNNWFWERTGLVLSFIQPVLMVLLIALLNLVYGYLFETRRRERIKEMFGQYVPEKFIDEMLKTSSDYGLHGEDRNMSVLFADIRDFTTISENLTAAQLVDMLNAYFTPMTEIIFHHRGTIDKYVGDLIMAFWGAPLKDRHHARHAIESALEMQKQLRALNQAATNKQEIRIGIGINTGIMSVGNMGSRYRRNYTVLGDAVNLASRIESLTKFYGVDTIISSTTHEHQSKFVFRTLDRVKVKGKNAATDLYEVICYQSELTPALKKELNYYHEALNDYFAQQWQIAYDKMNELSKEHPETKIYQIYLERIHTYMQNPLPADWDGVYAHVSK